MTELKPCPFCGCDVASRPWTFQHDSNYKGAQYIQCPMCGIRTPTMNNEYELTTLWNKRVDE